MVLSPNVLLVLNFVGVKFGRQHWGGGKGGDSCVTSLSDNIAFYNNSIHFKITSLHKRHKPFLLLLLSSNLNCDNERIWDKF